MHLGKGDLQRESCVGELRYDQQSPGALGRNFRLSEHVNIHGLRAPMSTRVYAIVTTLCQESDTVANCRRWVGSWAQDFGKTFRVGGRLCFRQKICVLWGRNLPS